MYDGIWRSGTVLIILLRIQHAKGWPPAVDSAIDEFRVHGYCSEDIVDALRKGSVDPGEIKKVIYRCVASNYEEGR